MKMPKTSPTFRAAAALSAVGVALALSVSSANAADQTANEHPTAQTSTGGAGSSKLARDEHDTVMSNEMRTNTVGRNTDITDAKLSRGDRHFLEKAARSGMVESRVARLAVARATDPRVRAFAEQIVADHEKTNAELGQLAGRKGVSMAGDEENDRLFKRLSDKSGSDFDQNFVGHMADEHADDIDLFEKAARKSDDADIAAFASKHLPVLEEHRSKALELEKTLKGK